MGYIKEPKGVTLLVEKQKMSSEIEERIKKFISESKKKNEKILAKLKLKK